MTSSPKQPHRIPPSDTRLNRLDIVLASIALGIVAVYFSVHGICALCGIALSLRVFTFGVLPAEAIFLTVGIYTSLFQLLRHRYLSVRLAFGAQIFVLAVLIVNVSVIAGLYGAAALVA